MDENVKDINKANEKVKSLEIEVNNTKELLANANKEIDSYKYMDIEIAEIELNNKLEKYVDKLSLKNDIYKSIYW